MDLNNLKQTVSNLTLYDLKAGVRKMQNAVMNYTEMEAKVREATNNEPWGASSTQMQEIADGTFNYQTLNEIMPMIYRRFTEKSAEEWRQIYKALQLLEYLIKHGSERVIDDARSHITLLKMLRQFHFIDQNGKDQGVNVRHRAKELAELLSDVDRIRAERKKARANKGKFTSMQGGGGFGSGSRYGGFGSDSGYGGGSSSTYGGYSGGVYGDGGGFGGQSDDYRSTQSRADKFEEYDEFDEGERPAASASASRVSRDTTQRAGVKRTTEPPKKKEPEVDLFDFDAPAAAAAPAAPAAAPPTGLTSLASGANDDDEFDDFQSAAPSNAPATSFTGSRPPPITAAAPNTQFAAPKPMSAPQQANISGMVAMSSISPPPSSTASPAGNFSAFSTPLTTTTLSPAAQAPKPAGYQAATPNYFSSVQTVTSQQPATSTWGGQKPAGASAAAKPAAGGDAFGALWSQASVGIKKNTPTGPGPAMGQLAKEKSSAGIWGAATPSSAAKPASGGKPLGNGLDDLLG
ncbi:Epsin-3, clathrin recruitment and traffic between the Golgi and endosome [Madurella fahalii]|uniref:Epsin-3, clathrin recruitment and traffic between the Golgi and endosome n=1 Tax=Madurella fahalii TaxID=1157608 RepID=A0ABQ0FYM6_9PEZI